MIHETVLVAEQDANGEIAAVWCYRDNEKLARPMIYNDLTSLDVYTASFHGAPKQSIISHIESLPPRPAKYGVEMTGSETKILCY